jgi:hypothetical protein
MLDGSNSNLLSRKSSLLSRKPRPEMHFGVQARLVHHGIDPVGQIHLEDPGIALIPRVDQYEVVG